MLTWVRHFMVVMMATWVMATDAESVQALSCLASGVQSSSTMWIMPRLVPGVGVRHSEEFDR